jgi:hypothetical protein
MVAPTKAMSRDTVSRVRPPGRRSGSGRSWFPR